MSAYDPRMDDVRWTLTGRDQFRAEVFDGPTLAADERISVAPAAALEHALASLTTCEQAARALLAALDGMSWNCVPEEAAALRSVIDDAPR